MKAPLLIAHISDLHFYYPTFNPLQIFSKRWLGNLNALFTRKKEYCHQRLYDLIDFFKEKGVTHVIISGDLTTTSLKKEMELASHFVAKLQEAQFKVYTVPGNHDHYTHSAYNKKLFYQFFPPLSPSAKEEGISVDKLSEKWWLISLDTAIPTPWYSSCGYFSEELEKRLEKALSHLPSSALILLVNHFPFFQSDSVRKKLIRGDALQALICRFPQIQFYLHGHTHRHIFADLRDSGLPIILDSGSTAHGESGSWNLIELKEKKSTISCYLWNGNWKMSQQHALNF